MKTAGLSTGQTNRATMRDAIRSSSAVIEFRSRTCGQRRLKVRRPRVSERVTRARITRSRRRRHGHTRAPSAGVDSHVEGRGRTNAAEWSGGGGRCRDFLTFTPKELINKLQRGFYSFIYFFFMTSSTVIPFSLRTRPIHVVFF